MPVYHQLQNIVTADELEKRWSFTISEIEQVVKNGKLQPFWLKDKRKSADGRAYYLCEFLPGRKLPRGEEVWGTIDYITDGLVFSFFEVTDYENENTYLKDSVLPSDNQDTNDEWVSGCQLQKKLGMSPSQFCSFIFENKIKCYHEGYDFGKSWISEHDFEKGFDLNEIEDVKFHLAELREYAETIPLLSDFCLSGTNIERQNLNFTQFENNIETYKAHIKELENKNTAFQARIAELEEAILASGQGDQNGKPRTASACEAAQTSRVEVWKGYAVIMAKVAYDCGLEARQQVTRPEYKQLAKRYGELSGQALELLRGALPEGVTKKTGGPTSQG